MKYRSFSMRVFSLLVIVAAIAGYNWMQKEQTQTQELAELTKKVEALENQQTELLTAMKEAAEKKQEQEAEKTADAKSQKSTGD